MTQSRIPINALEDLLQYCWEAEVRSYFDDECSEDHAFNDVIKIAKWLSTVPDAACDWGDMLKDLEKEIADVRAEAS
jgi:hypothetical protein